MRSPSTTLQTSATTLEIVEKIKELDGTRLSDLAEEMPQSRSTIYKHLATLERTGFLVKSDGEYHLGLKFLNLGEYARTRRPAHELIEETVRRLTDETDEEVDFVVEDHGQIITVSESYHKWVKYGDPTEDRYRARTGTYYHMHATASGKAILAAYPREHVERIVGRWGLPTRTANTITDREELFAELAEIRERGYAYDDEEYTDGLRSVGKSVEAPDCRVLGAISVSGPSYRIQNEVFRSVLPDTVEETVEDLEEAIEAEDVH